MVSACSHLLCSFLGNMPTTASLMFLYFSIKSQAKSLMVLAIMIDCLTLGCHLKLLVPPQRITLAGLVGSPPCWVRQAIFSILSPPMPRFNQSGKFSWYRWLKHARDRRSKWESPMMQFWGDVLLQRTWCRWNFCPQDWDGCDKLTWSKFLGVAVRELVSGPNDRSTEQIQE